MAFDYPRKTKWSAPAGCLVAAIDTFLGIESKSHCWYRSNSFSMSELSPIHKCWSKERRLPQVLFACCCISLPYRQFQLLYSHPFSPLVVYNMALHLGVLSQVVTICTVPPFAAYKPFTSIHIGGKYCNECHRCLARYHSPSSF